MPQNPQTNKLVTSLHAAVAAQAAVQQAAKDEAKRAAATVTAVPGPTSPKPSPTAPGNG